MEFKGLAIGCAFGQMIEIKKKKKNPICISIVRPNLVKPNPKTLVI